VVGSKLDNRLLAEACIAYTSCQYRHVMIDKIPAKLDFVFTYLL
jgi:hypothetical protein